MLSTEAVKGRAEIVVFGLRIGQSVVLLEGLDVGRRD